jgi:co-chaperonin GroES (HSP10)
MSDNITALGRHILIEKIENEVESKTIIAIPDKVNVDSYAFAKVVSASEGYYDKNDKYVKMSVKAGDIIVYKEESALKVDKRLFLIEEHIFAIVN